MTIKLNYEKHICPNQTADVVKENGNWHLDNGFYRGLVDGIHFCPFCGKLLKKMMLNIISAPLCGVCGGTGVLDSGGTTPWGMPLMMPCSACNVMPAPDGRFDNYDQPIINT